MIRQPFDGDTCELAYTYNPVEGQCRLKAVFCLRFNCLKHAFYVFCCLLMLGLPYLLSYWWPQLQRYFCFDLVPVSRSDHLLIVNDDETVSIVELFQEDIPTQNASQIRITCFLHRYLNYIVRQGAVQVLLYDYSNRLAHISSQWHRHGLLQIQAAGQRKAYGLGAMEIEKVSALVLFLREVFRPLYFLTLLGLLSWVYINYIKFALVVLITTIGSMALGLVSLLQVHEKISHMAYYITPVSVLRDNEVREISSEEVVPGDIVFFQGQVRMPFEAVVLAGEALMNQAILTGESVPVLKKQVDFSRIQQSSKLSSTLYDGTSIIQTSIHSSTNSHPFHHFGIAVMVVKTNFLTLKGQLIRAILYPKEQQNEFQRESTLFLLFLFGFSVVSFLVFALQYYKYIGWKLLIDTFINLVTIAVAPSLPVSMTLGIIYASQKLAAKKIFSTSPNKVIKGGRVNLVCFDKTGTLTENFMGFKCLLLTQGAIFSQQAIDCSTELGSLKDSSNPQRLLAALNNMGTNHSLVRLDTSEQIIGDSMEIKLFEFANFKFDEQHEADSQAIENYTSAQTGQVSTFRKFEFTSELQRMSVVVGYRQQFRVYAKGSPEIMLKLMRKQSIPVSYAAKLKQLTSKGLRVLAIASKTIEKWSSISREEAQKDLIFDGFQVFENSLKPATIPTIIELKQAQLQIVMITGDNPFTAASISLQSAIISPHTKVAIIDELNGNVTVEDVGTEGCILQCPQVADDGCYQEFALSWILEAQPEQCLFCMTGSAFNFLLLSDASLIQQQISVLNRTLAFARTKPDQKASIVRMYQLSGRVVAMCGDGANDCIAMKQADVGLSLSQAEASISAPFTSQVQDISSMTELLKQCRAGLATNFSIFNISALYSLIQYSAAFIAQQDLSVPAEMHYLYWDMFCNFVFMTLMGYTATADTLSVSIPLNSLCGAINLIQIATAVVLQFLVQMLAIALIEGPFAEQLGFNPRDSFLANEEQILINGYFPSNGPKVYAIFFVSSFMYIFTLIAFSVGAPWRKNFWTNFPFLTMLIVMMGCNVCLSLFPSFRPSILKLDAGLPQSLDQTLIGLSILGGCLIIIVQKFVLEPLSQMLNRV